MAILYTATRPSDFTWPAANLTSFGLTKNTRNIDGAYVVHGLGNTSVDLNARANHGEPSGNTLWFHFDFSIDFEGFADSGYFMEMRDASDNRVLFIDIISYTGLQIYVYGNATSPVKTVSDMMQRNMDYDISVTVDGINTTVKIYQRSQLIHEISTPNTGTVGKPAYTEINLHNMNYRGNTAISQMIWADETTRGMKLAEIPLDETGTQTYTDWSGQTKNLFNNNEELYIISNSAPGNKFTSTLGFDSISKGFHINEFSVGGQDPSPTDIFFKSDGTKLYMSGTSNDTIYQYTLSTPWDLSSASYDSVSFSFGSQDTAPYGFYIKPDGTKLYMSGLSGDRIYQYTLGTPWDLSSASYDSVSFLVSGQTLDPRGVEFKPDGTKMYISGDSGNLTNSIIQYTLSTPWDLSSASYDGVSFEVSNQDFTPTGVRFNSIGNKMYVLGSNGDRIYQYTLGTPWDLSSIIVYNNLQLYVGDKCTYPEGIFLNNSDRIYVVDYDSSTVHEYQIDNFFSGERTGYEIKTVRMSSRAWKSSDATITNFRHMTRVGTTDYDGSTVHATSDQTRNPFQTDFPVNPATAVAWTFSEVEAAEFGVKTEL